VTDGPPPPELDTIPKLLLRNASQYGRRPAYREKDLGVWQSWTWAQVLEEVRALALGLERLGLKRGNTIAIIGDNRPHLYWTFTAAQSLGAIPVPLYQDAVADEMAYVLEHAEVCIAVVEDQEQADKVLSVAARLPKLERVIYDDPRGLEDYDHSRLNALADVQKSGRDALAADPKAAETWRQRIAEGKASDVSVILYTSGTTGRPKGVMLSHENVVVSGRNANAFDHFTPDDTMIAYLPMAWVGDHIFSYGQAFAGALTVCCPESPETATDDRREIGPTYFFAPPRVFETLLTAIMVRMEDAGRIKKAMFD
jgi:long-chain acyl-CoA synthetase